MAAPAASITPPSPTDSDHDGHEARAARGAAGAPSGPDPFAREQVERVLRDYEKNAEYPPGSRPFAAGDAYKLAWNQAAAPPLPELARDGLALRYGADRAHVMPGETLTSWIEVFHEKDPTRRVAFSVKEAWVVAIGGERTGREAPLVYTRDGEGRFVNRLEPGKIERFARRCEAVRLEAYVEVEGRVNLIHRDFTFTPRETVKLRGMRDELRQGSLVVTLDVDVREAGVFTFEGNLVDAGGEPLVWVDQSAELAVGRHDVELVFFGKAIRDKGAAGPWTLRDVHGVMRSQVAGEMPLRFAFAEAHTTRAHALAELSPDVWQSPEKEETQAVLEALAASAGDTDPASAGKPPKRYIVVGEDGVAREFVDGVEQPKSSFGK